MIKASEDHSTSDGNTGLVMGDSEGVGTSGGNSQADPKYPTLSASDESLSTFTNIPYGYQTRGSYDHGNKSTDFIGVTYNDRTKYFVLMDTRGITLWRQDDVGTLVERAMNFPKYQFLVLKTIVFSSKHNVYFCLGRDFTIKVLNKDFQEISTVSAASVSSVSYCALNDRTGQLITGGPDGTKIWDFRHSKSQQLVEIKAMANYALHLGLNLPHVGGTWVKKIYIDVHQQHMYLCSETSVHTYSMDGSLQYKINRAHKQSITGCVYSPSAKHLITASADCLIKVWQVGHGHVHTFRGHSKPITCLLLHPDYSSWFLTSSQDGTVRMWSLDTMDNLYSMQVSTDIIRWMGLTADRRLYCSTPRQLSVWSLNQTYSFWAISRCRVTSIHVVSSQGRTSRVMVVGDDSSVRLISTQKGTTGVNLCTVLPPSSVSALTQVISVSYNRQLNQVFLLTSPTEVWVYTTRTHPACLLCVWDLMKQQHQYLKHSTNNADSLMSSKFQTDIDERHLATENGGDINGPCDCHCLTSLSSPVMLWKKKQGLVWCGQSNFVLLGMQDGRVLFMDPQVNGLKHLELRADIDPILNLSHEMALNVLIIHVQKKNKINIKLWTLPDLEPTMTFTCDCDLVDYSIMESLLLTGHRSGKVSLHQNVMLELTTGDRATERGATGKREHSTPVTSVDSNHCLQYFISTDMGGVLKIWTKMKYLLAEVTLDQTLSSAAFLNNHGDILIGFKNQIFLLDHKRVFGDLKEVISDDDDSELESYIYEDPAVRYDMTSRTWIDATDMENYLIPYMIKFNRNFFEGNIQNDQDEITSSVSARGDSETDTDSQFSAAPTDTYLSINSPPRCPSVSDTLPPTGTRQYRQDIAHFSTRLSDDTDQFRLPNVGVTPTRTPEPELPPQEVSVGDDVMSESGDEPGEAADDDILSDVPDPDLDLGSDLEEKEGTDERGEGTENILTTQKSRFADIRLDSIRLKPTETILKSDHGSTLKTEEKPTTDRVPVQTPEPTTRGGERVKRTKEVVKKQRVDPKTRVRPQKSTTGDDVISLMSMKPDDDPPPDDDSPHPNNDDLPIIDVPSVSPVPTPPPTVVTVTQAPPTVVKIRPAPLSVTPVVPALPTVAKVTPAVVKVTRPAVSRVTQAPPKAPVEIPGDVESSKIKGENKGTEWTGIQSSGSLTAVDDTSVCVSPTVETEDDTPIANPISKVVIRATKRITPSVGGSSVTERLSQEGKIITTNVSFSPTIPTTATTTTRDRAKEKSTSAEVKPSVSESPLTLSKPTQGQIEHSTDDITSRSQSVMIISDRKSEETKIVKTRAKSAGGFIAPSDYNLEELKRAYSQGDTERLLSFLKIDGVSFHDNWQRRMIDRHKLVNWLKDNRTKQAVIKNYIAHLERLSEKRKYWRKGGSSVDAFVKIHNNNYNTDLHQSPEVDRKIRPYSASCTQQRGVSSSPPHHQPSPDIPCHTPSNTNTQYHTSSSSSSRRPATATPWTTPSTGFQRNHSHQKQSLDVPYRFSTTTMDHHPCGPLPDSLQQSESVFETPRVSGHEPRLVRRPRSSKSIPSKCRRYVLVRGDDSSNLKPDSSSRNSSLTILEHKLLQSRFPKQLTDIISKQSLDLTSRCTTPIGPYLLNSNTHSRRL